MDVCGAIRCAVNAMRTVTFYIHAMMNRGANDSTFILCNKNIHIKYVTCDGNVSRLI